MATHASCAWARHNTKTGPQNKNRNSNNKRQPEGANGRGRRRQHKKEASECPCRDLDWTLLPTSLWKSTKLFALVLFLFSTHWARRRRRRRQQAGVVQVDCCAYAWNRHLLLHPARYCACSFDLNTSKAWPQNPAAEVTKESLPSRTASREQNLIMIKATTRLSCAHCFYATCVLLLLLWLL